MTARARSIAIVLVGLALAGNALPARAAERPTDTKA
jgi:hypothetical protein